MIEVLLIVFFLFRLVWIVGKVVSRMLLFLLRAAGITPYSLARAIRLLSRQRSRRHVLPLLVFAALASAAHGQILVDDPANLKQMIQSVATGLQQLSQLEQQLQAEQQMLKQIGGGLSLQSVVNLQAESQSVLQQMGLVIATGSAAINAGTLTPQQVTQTYAAINSTAAQAAVVQSKIIANQPAIANEVQAAAEASQAAAGQTAATQATNQILVALSQQMADIQASLITLNQITAQKQQQDAAAVTSGQQNRAAPQSLPAPQNWSDLYASH